MQKNLTHKKFSLSGKISLSLIVFLALFALFAPLFLPYVPNEIELDSKFAPPSFSHFLGTDYLGRDIFTRLVYGARISLGASLAIVCLILFFWD